jgi:hypothetical protein
LVSRKYKNREPVKRKLSSRERENHGNWIHTLLVGNFAESFVGINASQVGLQLGELVISSQIGDGLLQIIVSNEHLEVADRLRVVDLGKDQTLQVDTKALVEPEIRPTAVGNEVSCPAMGDFVGDDVGERAVAGQERGRQESELRVLHSTIRECIGKNHTVILAPAVWDTSNLLTGLDVLLSVGGKFMHRSIQQLLLGPDERARANLSLLKCTSDDGDQISGDGKLLLVVVGQVAIFLEGGILTNGSTRASSDEGRRNRYSNSVWGLDGRGVLAGQQSTGQNSLALSVHVRVTLAVGLGGLEPLDLIREKGVTKRTRRSTCGRYVRRRTAQWCCRRYG